MLANSVDEPAGETEVLPISALQSKLEKTCSAISYKCKLPSHPLTNPWMHSVKNLTTMNPV